MCSVAREGEQDGKRQKFNPLVRVDTINGMDPEAARQRVMLAEDHERIARDLHDTVIQRLFASGLSLQSIVNAVPDAVRSKIERILDDRLTSHIETLLSA